MGRLGDWLQSQRKAAEKLDMNLFLNNNCNIELELALTRINQRWQKLSAVLNKIRRNADNLSSKYEQFQRLANELLDVSEDLKRRLTQSVPSIFSSSIEGLKEQFDHLIVSKTTSLGAFTSIVINFIFSYLSYLKFFLYISQIVDHFISNH